MCQRGENADLVRRIMPPHIQRGIRLGIPLLLSQLHRRIKLHPLIHLGEDEITGTIENSVEVGHPVAHKRFADHFDDRHAAGHTGFVI